MIIKSIHILFFVSLLFLLAVVTAAERYSCSREKRLSGECRWCTRDVPSKGGIWTFIPPYWQYGDCPMQYFSPAQVQQCLKGRTMYAIGNSIGRQALFNMVELLGGNPVKREDQRDLCPKHETTWEDSCHQNFADVKFKYLFINYPDGFHYADRNGFPYFRYQTNSSDGKQVWTTGRIPEYGNNGFLDNATANGIANLYAEDNCIHHDVRSCFSRFFQNSTKDDILFISHGLPIPIDNHEPQDGKVGIDTRAWVTASASAMKSHIEAAFTGQVFRANLAEMNKYLSSSYRSAQLKLVNEAVQAIWAPGSEELPWYSIDQWAINENRHHFYSDHIHFNGILSHAGLFQLLNELCPGGGTTTWTYPKDGKASTVYSEAEATILRLPQTIHNNWFMVMYKGKRHDIPDMDTLQGMEIPASDYLVISKAGEYMFVK